MIVEIGYVGMGYQKTSKTWIQGFINTGNLFLDDTLLSLMTVEKLSLEKLDSFGPVDASINSLLER